MDVLEAYERLIYDAMSGDRTLFADAAGIERLWEISEPLLRAAARRDPLLLGLVGSAADDSLISPRTWRLPFERKWREKVA